MVLSNQVGKPRRQTGASGGEGERSVGTQARASTGSRRVLPARRGRACEGASRPWETSQPTLPSWLAAPCLVRSRGIGRQASRTGPDASPARAAAVPVVAVVRAENGTSGAKAALCSRANLHADDHEEGRDGGHRAGACHTGVEGELEVNGQAWGLFAVPRSLFFTP